jgi:hypothetical protein
MMLVASPGAGPPMFFASLLNPALLHALAGFEQVGDDELPAEASLLVGHNHAFETRFRYPKRKPAG